MAKTSFGSPGEVDSVIPKPMSEVEFGVGINLPFSTTYSGPPGSSKVLYEQLKLDDTASGPSVGQLRAMRRSDGQARALYRLITLPVKAALSGARVVTSEVFMQMSDLGEQLAGTPEAPAAEAPSGEDMAAGDPAVAATSSGSAVVSLAVPAVDPAASVDPAAVDPAAPIVPAPIVPAPIVPIAPPKPPPVGEEEATFIRRMLFLPPSSGGMTVSMRTVIAQFLLAVFDGFSPFEMVNWVPKRGPLKGKWSLKKIAYRPADTVTFLTDENGHFAGFRQQTILNGKPFDKTIKPESAIYYAANEEERPFYGVSFFESAFYHYDMKYKLYFIAHLAAQRAAVGTRVGTMPQNASGPDKRKFEKALSDLGFAQSVTLPSPDWAIDILKDGGSFDFMSFVNHHNSEMSKSVLAGFLDQSQGSGANESTITSPASASGAAGLPDMFVSLLRSIMDDIAAVINEQIIPRFIDWNFGSDDYPKFVWGAFTDAQETEIREVFKALAPAAQTGATPEFIRALEKRMSEALSLDVDYTAVEAREAEEKAAAAMQAQMGVGPDGAPLAGGGPGAAGGPPVGGPPMGGDQIQVSAIDKARQVATDAGISLSDMMLSAFSDSEDPLLALSDALLKAAISAAPEEELADGAS